MSVDKRNEHGQFYPTGEGSVEDREEQVGVSYVTQKNCERLPERYNNKMMMEKINELADVVSGRVATVLLVALSLFNLYGQELTVQKAKMEDIFNDQEVVTDVQLKGTIDVSSQIAPLAESVSNKVDKAELKAVSNILQTAVNAKQDQLQQGGYYSINVSNSDTANSTGYSIDSSYAVYAGEAFGAHDDLPIRETYATKNELNTAIEGIDVTEQIVPIEKDLSELGSTVNQWTRYWSGDDFRVVVTNYPTTPNANRSPSGYMPQLSMSWKTEDKNGTNYFQTVWSETWWQDWLMQNYLPTNYYSKAETDAIYALKAWGFYDSQTGYESPEGILQISADKIHIAHGVAYQQIESSGMWVLCGNGFSTSSTTNDFFRISDAEDNPIFEVVKGDRRTVGADASKTTVINAYATPHLQITYNVISETNPVLHVCSDLRAADWQQEGSEECIANVSWSGESGNYLAEVWLKDAYSANSMVFVKGSYEIGGETYIKNSAPVSMEYIYLGGVKYRLGTATIDGNTVLTLTKDY